MEILVDDRERAVIPFMEEYSTKFNISWKVQRCTVGDYAICYKGFVLCIIERKTWTDLASSMRDGRKENVEKLLAARAESLVVQCKLAYCIEGPPCPQPDRLFSRIPAKHLRSHLDHLAFRDSIAMLYTLSEQDTASRLFELASNFLTIKNVIHQIDNTTGGNTDILQKKHESRCYNVQLLQCIPGVGSIVASILDEAGITLHTLYLDSHTVEEIAVYKYSSGKQIGPAKAAKVIQCSKYLKANGIGAKAIQARILSAIPLISKQSAVHILSQYTFVQLYNMEIQELATLQKSSTATIGNKGATWIYNCLRGENEN